MPYEPVLPVFPGRGTPLDLWLRWNRPGSLPAELVIEAPPELVVGPSSRQVLDAAVAPLDCVSFSVRARPELPQGLSRLACRLRTAEGLEQVREVRVLRPYRWLVSQALRLNPTAGLDQLAELDAALVAAPLGRSHGIEWQEAQPHHFTAFGLLDLRQAVSPQPFVQAYAFARVAGSGGPAVLDITHDDWLRVWLNGDCVFSSQESAPSTLTRSRVEVTLRPGENEVLVRCAQLRNYWEFGLVAEAAEASGVHAGAPAGRPTVFLPEPLPRWALESIAEEAGMLAEAQPPGERWRVLAAACRDCPLVPVEPWPQLVSGVRYQTPGLPSHAGDPEEPLRCAEALLRLRQRAECAVGLSPAEVEALVSLTFHERALFLSAAGRPLEAALEKMGAIWRGSLPTDTHPQHAEVVRLFLSADAGEEAWAYAEGPASTSPQARGLQAVVALYAGDTERAEALLAGASASSAGAWFAEWLLGMGRASEAEWLLRRLERPSPSNLMSLARAYTDQRRFPEAEAVLRECLGRRDARRPEWENAAAAFAEFQAARCSLPAAVAAAEADLASLSPQVEDLRVRWLHVLGRLHQAAGKPVPALTATVAEADESAQRYRQAPGPALEPQLLGAMACLSGERQYEDMLRLCNQVVTVSPGVHFTTDVYRLQALLALGRTGAAEAVLARLAGLAQADAGRARTALRLLPVSALTAPAVARLARLALEHHAADRVVCGEAALALAYAETVLACFPEAVRRLGQALVLQDGPQRTPAVRVSLARSWVARCRELAQADPALDAALLASVVEPVSQAAASLAGSPAPAPQAAGPFEEDDESPWVRSPDELPGCLGPQGQRLEATALLRSVFGEGGDSRMAVEEGEPPRVWVLSPRASPACIELGRVERVERFPQALRAWCEPAPAARAIAFSDGLVWLGTDTGLYCYRRAWGAWDRLRWPGEAPGSAVSGLRVVDGVLELTAGAGEGAGPRPRFNLDTWTWEDRPGP
jgi:tetratricopeptide (TPR) repeat protein